MLRNSSGACLLSSVTIPTFEAIRDQTADGVMWTALPNPSLPPSARAKPQPVNFV